MCVVSSLDVVEENMRKMPRNARAQNEDAQTVEGKTRAMEE
jgi:hypothetical protein